MSNQQTLERAIIVEQLLEQNGVPVENLTVNAEMDSIDFRVDADEVDVNPDDEDTPLELGPSRIGGGTIKE